MNDGYGHMKGLLGLLFLFSLSLAVSLAFGNGGLHSF